MTDSARQNATISLTAHYTAQVWLRNGLSDARLRTSHGTALWYLLSPAMAASSQFGGPTLEDFLLARHAVIDLRLADAIDGGWVSQVIEIAAGLSPRGLRFARKYGDRLTYIEADLPGMAAHKRELLGARVPNHRIATINALAEAGPDSLAELVKTLDPAQGVAVITEGLLNYFDRDNVLRMWGGIARALVGFPHGLYLADIHVRGVNYGIATNAFMFALSTFVRSKVHLHFQDEREVARHLLDCGFADGTALNPTDFGDRAEVCDRKWAKLVRVVEATTDRPSC